MLEDAVYGDMMKRILVTGAGGPAGINFSMSLQIAPEKMFIGGTEANEYLTHIASTDECYLVPPATESNYIDEMNQVIQKEQIELVHAQPDVEVAVISENREKLRANVFLPAKKTIRTCQDKLESAKVWQKSSVSVARFMELQNKSDVNRAFEKFGSPIWIRATHGAGGKGSTPANNEETALSWMEYWKSRDMDWKFIAQEHLPGRNIGFHSLWKNGELVTSMARERLEYIYPHLTPSGITGTPSIQRTIHDEKVNTVGKEAVLSIDSNFNGIACVDLKENKIGTPYVTEINAGRMFTTSFFFSYASKKLRKDYRANMPYLYIKLAYKENIPNIEKHNILPENIYWIRHIDAEAKLVKDGKVVGGMYL